MQAEAEPARRGVAQVVRLHLRLDLADVRGEGLLRELHRTDRGDAGHGLGEVAEDGAARRRVKAAQVARRREVPLRELGVEHEHRDDEDDQVPTHEHADDDDRRGAPEPHEVGGHGGRQVVVQDVRVLCQAVQDLAVRRGVVERHLRPEQRVHAALVEAPGPSLADVDARDHVAEPSRHAEEGRARVDQRSHRGAARVAPVREPRVGHVLRRLGDGDAAQEAANGDHAAAGLGVRRVDRPGDGARAALLLARARLGSAGPGGRALAAALAGLLGGLLGGLLAGLLALAGLLLGLLGLLGLRRALLLRGPGAARRA